MPRIDAIDKVKVCYLGGDKTKAEFVSDRGYRVPACPTCILTCLGYEIGHEDEKGATLVKIDQFDCSYGEFVSEKGKTIKYIAI